MRLISLTANSSNFHSVTFNDKGPSLIIGKQKSRSEKDKSDQKTYNGVGKSLLLYLINYCLGADAKETFVNQLKGWEFTLKIHFAGNEISITRRLDESEIVQFGFEKLNLKDFRERLQDEEFPGTKEVKFLTFRSLMSTFLRPGKSAYTTFDGIHYSEKPVQKIMRAAFLLGLDVSLVVQKYDLRQELVETEDMARRFAKDPILKEYFQGKKDVNSDIQELKEEAQKLEDSLSGFKVAENYHEVEQQLAEARSAVQKMRNLALAAEARLRQIEESLMIKHGITLQMVQKTFEQIHIYFSNELIRSLAEIEAFHTKLLSTREERLKKEKKILEVRLATLNTKLEGLNREVDQHLRFLGDHGALGELLSLKDRANEAKNRLQRLVDYKNLTKRYKDSSAELAVAMANANLTTERYLSENESIIESAAEEFRKITKRIYPNKQSGLIIQNDSGDNQNRYTIDARIHDDASDGINEAKIFAYDMTLVWLRRNHKVRFLCHDSRIFSDVDPRQRAAILQIAYEMSNAGDFQYIATVNEDQIEILEPLLGEAEYKQMITDCTVLELKDDAPEDKLLGIDIDLDYD